MHRLRTPSGARDEDTVALPEWGGLDGRGHHKQMRTVGISGGLCVCGCEVQEGSTVTEVQMLDQLENVLIECEKAPKENTPTMKAFIILARVVYFLLKEQCKNLKQ
jgi:hypothetical protein